MLDAGTALLEDQFDRAGRLVVPVITTAAWPRAQHCRDEWGEPRLHEDLQLMRSYWAANPPRFNGSLLDFGLI